MCTSYLYLSFQLEQWLPGTEKMQVYHFQKNAFSVNFSISVNLFPAGHKMLSKTLLDKPSFPGVLLAGRSLRQL